MDADQAMDQKSYREGSIFLSQKKENFRDLCFKGERFFFNTQLEPEQYVWEVKQFFSLFFTRFLTYLSETICFSSQI